MKRILSIVFLIFLSHSIFAQTLEPSVQAQEAQQQLLELNLDDEEIRQKLLEKGIDINNIDPSDPAQVREIENALEESIQELEDEKRQKEQEVQQKEQEAQQLEEDAQQQADQTIENAEREAEQAVGEEIKEVTRESAEDIEKAVKDGATLEEAISEELIDAQSNVLPEATLWGQEMFRNKSIKVYRSAKEVKPPSSYVLGSGDVINVSIWGYSQDNVEEEINEDGYIQPYRMPRIYLKGVTLGKARNLLEKRFSQHYQFRPSEFEVTLNFARTITVNLVGEVENYGAFTFPAINTAFNALVAAGGPSDIGSVRNIKLIRAGENPKRIDVYEYLLNPSAEEKLYLQENDYIHVPVAERLVTIRGAVNRSFKYELIEGEDLKELITFAGGLKGSAYRGNIQVKRFVNDREEIIDVNLNEVYENNTNFKLLNGDEVMVLTIPKPYKNFVEVTGAVEISGKFQVTEGMKITEVLDRALLDDHARTDIAFLQRTRSNKSVYYLKVDLAEAINNPQSASNLVLQPKDKLIIYSSTRYVDQATISVTGAVRDGQEFELERNEKVRISDAVFMSGGLRYDATDFAYIHRRPDPNDEKQIEYIRVNLKEIVQNPESPANVELQGNDKLVVYSKLTYIDDFNITLSGAVRNPGEYQYDASLTLKDMLVMAGGLKLEASSSRIDVYRLEIDEKNKTETIAATLEVNDDYELVNGGEDFILQPYDQIIVRQAPEFELLKSITIRGEVAYPGQYAILGDNEKITSIIQRAGGFTNEAFPPGATLYRTNEGVGFIIVDLDDAMRNNSSKFNYRLKEGDIIEIPKTKDIVTITGATRIKDLYPGKVSNTGKVNVAHHKGKNAKFYIDKYAAGIGERGKKRLITVEHPNGKVERTKSFLFFRKYPSVRAGSVVKVGSVPEKEKEIQEERRSNRDWGDILSSTVTQATAILSLILLVQNVD